MGRRLFAALFVVLASLGRAGAATDVPYTVLVDGRPLTGKIATTGALQRNGVLFIDVVVAVKTFSGLLTFADRGATVKLTVRGRTGSFTLGSKQATIEGKPVAMRAAPFRANGDYFVPIVPVATLGYAKLKIDNQYRTASLSVRPFARMRQANPVPGGGAPSQAPAAQALRLSATGTSDARGALHASLKVTNTTQRPYTLEFASGARVTFVVVRGDTQVWDSATGKLFVQSLGSQTLAPHATWSLDETWPGFGATGVGAYQLHARLMSSPPLDAPVVFLGGPATAPAPSGT
jgi:hypothetical protein